MDIRDKRKIHEIDERTEKLAYLPLDEFVRESASGVQALLREVLAHLRQMERTVEELQRARTQLDDARRECVDLYEFAPVGYFNLNDHGDIARVNITASDMLNVQRNALTTRPFEDFVEPRHRRRFADFLDELAQTRARTSTELEMKRGDGSVFYAQLQAVPLYEGSSIVFRVSIADVTKRKQAEDALHESELRLRNVFQSMDEGFALCEMIYDTAGNPVNFRFLEVNPAFAKQTGFTPEQVIGRTVRELIPKIEPLWIETYARVVKTGRSEQIESGVSELNKTFDVHAWRSGPSRFGVVFQNVGASRTAKSARRKS